MKHLTWCNGSDKPGIMRVIMMIFSWKRNAANRRAMIINFIKVIWQTRNANIKCIQ